MKNLLAGPLLAGAVIATGCTAAPAEQENVAETDSPLKTDEHQRTTSYLCLDAGLSQAFCARLAAEAFNVDRIEWNNLEAHAMNSGSQTLCDAAASTQARLRRRGGEIHALLAQHTLQPADMDALASSLGRALHTIQDNCAHEGMTNPQHSWYSNRGWCLSDGEDPDEQASAIQCARDETWTVMLAFVQAVKNAHYQVAAIGSSSSLGTANPDRDQVCSFLREWQNFDGRDHRWDNAVTIPAFRSTFIEKFTTGADVADVCQGLQPVDGHSPIAIHTPRARVAVSDPLCFTTKAYCLGE
jgi:hypothetical protein